MPAGSRAPRPARRAVVGDRDDRRPSAAPPARRGAPRSGRPRARRRRNDGSPARTSSAWRPIEPVEPRSATPRGRARASVEDADDIEVRDGRREQERVDPVEHAAVAGDERARLLRAGRALEHRLGEVAGLRRRARRRRPKPSPASHGRPSAATSTAPTTRRGDDPADDALERSSTARCGHERVPPEAPAGEVRGRVERPDDEHERRGSRPARARASRAARRDRPATPAAASRATNPSRPTYSAPNVVVAKIGESLARVHAGSARRCPPARSRAPRAAGRSRRAASFTASPSATTTARTMPSMGIEGWPAAVRSRNASTAREDDGDPTRTHDPQPAEPQRDEQWRDEDRGTAGAIAEHPVSDRNDGSGWRTPPGRGPGRPARSPARACRSSSARRRRTAR